jgi:aminoglycoside phosphotransferase family enzyme/predicted kinase
MPEPIPPLIGGLLYPQAYPHSTEQPIRLAETHISWVLLTGPYAYKIKKPVDFGFLDFSTLPRRLACCQAEVRLNRRYAPDLYLGVVPITGSAEHPCMGGTGEPIEYAVQMRQFAETQLFDRLLADGRLLPEHLDRLAERLALFHAGVDRSTPDDAHGLPHHIREAAEHNFSAIGPRLDDSTDLGRLETLRAWTFAEFGRREALFWERKQAGCVREGHGDLHLRNVVLIGDEPTLFDGIEFSEDLRWIDVASETAFLAMDLETHGTPDLAYRFLNRYLEFTGDYPGLVLFDFYRLYRALVRAKIAQLTRAQTREPGRRAALLSQYRAYITYGLGLIEPRRPRLFITRGLSGSGKSHLAERLAERLPAIRLRSDVERKRLAGLPPAARTGATPGTGIYTAETTENIYRHLAAIAGRILAAGQSVIVDATFLKRLQREDLRKVSAGCGADFLVLDCQAPLEAIRERLENRARCGRDPSEADWAVVENQLASQEPLDDAEAAYTLAVDTGSELRIENLVASILERTDRGGRG